GNYRADSYAPATHAAGTSPPPAKGTTPNTGVSDAGTSRRIQNMTPPATGGLPAAAPMTAANAYPTSTPPRTLPPNAAEARPNANQSGGYDARGTPANDANYARPPEYNAAANRTVANPVSTSPPREKLAAGQYEVQPNDSFWVISTRLYGTGN